MSSAWRARSFAIGLVLFGWAVAGFAQSDANGRSAIAYSPKYVLDPKAFMWLFIYGLIIWLFTQNRALRRRLAKLEEQLQATEDDQP